MPKSRPHPHRRGRAAQLPAELNPGEHVWNEVKHHGLGRQTLTGPRDLKTKVLSHLRRLQQQPTKV